MELRDDYVARARALAPEVEAHAALIEQDRRLPPPSSPSWSMPGSSTCSCRAPSAAARWIPARFAGHPGDRPGRCQHGLVPLSGLRLLDVGGVSEPGGGARDLRCARLDPRVGTGAKGASGGGGRRLPGQRHVELRQRMPSRHVARRPTAPSTTRTARRRTADGAAEGRTMLFPAAEATLLDVWHVGGLRGTASDAFRVDGALRPARAGHAARRSARAAGVRAALLLSVGQPVFLRVRQRGPRHRAGQRSTRWSSWRGTRAARHEPHPAQQCGGPVRRWRTPRRSSPRRGSCCTPRSTRSGHAVGRRGARSRWSSGCASGSPPRMPSIRASRSWTPCITIAGATAIFTQRPLRPALPGHPRGHPAGPGPPGPFRDGRSVPPRAPARHDVPITVNTRGAS